MVLAREIEENEESMGGGGRILHSKTRKEGANMKASVKNRPAIIAGNGPSLARIDYTRLPQEFDVYRCNRFYFEEKYYLGKRVQGVLFHPDLFFAQYLSLIHI